MIFLEVADFPVGPHERTTHVGAPNVNSDYIGTFYALTPVSTATAAEMGFYVSGPVVLGGW